MKKYVLLIIILFGTAVDYYSMQNEIDSLEVVVKSETGEKKVDVLNRLSDLYYYIDTDKAIKYAEESISLAETIDYEKGLAAAYGSLGFAYVGFDAAKAIEYTQKALSIRRKINHLGGISTSLNVMGVIHYYYGDYLRSIEYHIKSIRIKEKIGNKNILATSYNNIALVYMAVEDYDKALEYLFKAMELRIETNGPRSTGLIKTNIGEIYSRLGDNEKAIEYFNEALELNKESNSKSTIAYSYYCYANLYTNLNKFESALAFYDSSLVMYRELDIKNGIANSENGIAKIYRLKNQFDKAIYHAEIALENGEKINALDNIYKATSTLYYCYQQKGKYKTAYDYLLKNKSVQDSLKNENKLKKIARIELDYKIEKMQQEQERELSRQKVYIQFLIIILISGSIILLLIVRSFRNKKQANIKLNKLNEQLSEVNSAKDRFLAIIAHDLRGPYQSTLGLSGLLDSQFSTLGEAEKKNSISNLNSSLKKQYELLNDLLKWANMHGGNFKINKEKLFLSECANDVFKLLGPAAEKKNISLKNNIENDLSVSADRYMLNLLLRNLVSNSIKFTKEKGSVEISAVELEDDIQIIINDNGIGIEEEILKKLFRIDVQYSNKGTFGEEGSGLGLILCKEIIDKHSGTIRVESEINKGSRFIITLPK